MHVAEIDAPEGIRPIDSVEKGGCIFIADGEFVSAVVYGVSFKETGYVFPQCAKIEVGDTACLGVFWGLEEL